MNKCCFGKDTKSYYNNIAFHLAKNVIEKRMMKIKDSDVLDWLNKIIYDLDDIFPSEDNAWNYLFERKLIELGFFYEEDKEKVAEIKAIYDKKARISIKERERLKEIGKNGF